MRFFRPILQTVLAGIILALPIGAYTVYAEFQHVKYKVKSVDSLSAEMQTIKTEISSLRSDFEHLPTKIEAMDKRINRRLADVPLCRRR